MLFKLPAHIIGVCTSVYLLQASAGEALVSLLCSQGHHTTATALCQEILLTAESTTAPSANHHHSHSHSAPSPKDVSWARRRLPALLLQQGDAAGAVSAAQVALREDASDAGTWAGLGAAYQALGRHIAALKVCMLARIAYASVCFLGCMCGCACIPAQACKSC